jgi:hypothetical protein
VYEYNPFRNYRLSESKYWYKEAYYDIDELRIEFGITPDSENKKWL